MTPMRIGVGIAADALEDGIAEVKRAEDAGFQAAWFSNIFGADALTWIALAGRETSRIELGTAVVPTHSRHPLYMAQQALTAQAACDGRFVLGLGPSHKVVIEDMLGLDFSRPARHVREYVEVVRPLVRDGKVDFQGEVYRVRGQLRVPGAAPVPVLVGGLGPQMRRVAGGVADGTITWMTGRRTLAEEIVPGVREAAWEAGRPDPRVVAALPVAQVPEGEEGAARERISQILSIYPNLPSYKAMLELEGAAGAGDIALVGGRGAIEDGLAALDEAGVTDFMATLMPVGSRPKDTLANTFDLLAGLARDPGRA